MRLQGTCSGRAARHDPWPFPTTPGSRPPTIELDCGKVPLGCKANSGRAARLQGYRATRLQGYRATGLHTSETSFMSDSCRTYPSGQRCDFHLCVSNGYVARLRKRSRKRSMRSPVMARVLRPWSWVSSILSSACSCNHAGPPSRSWPRRAHPAVHMMLIIVLVQCYYMDTIMPMHCGVIRKQP